MNEPETSKNRVSLFAILAALVPCVIVALFALFLATASVTGSATLPNGSSVGITTKWGFAVSSKDTATRIEAGSYVVEVAEDLTVNVNGTEVGVLDTEPKSYQLVVNASGLEMSCAEGVVARLE